MKTRQTFLLLTILITVSSCASFFYGPTIRLMEVEMGMTKEEVKQLSGKPSYRRINDRGEEWEYRNATASGWNVYVISFVSERVTTVDMFFEQICAQVATIPPVNQTPVIITTSTSQPGGSQDPLFYREVAMDRRAFERFLISTKQQHFDSDRTKSIETALFTSYFISEQCVQLISLYSFGSNKVYIIKKLYPRVTDKQNFFMVIDRLTFQSDKDQVNDFIKSYHSNKHN